MRGENKTSEKENREEEGEDKPYAIWQTEGALVQARRLFVRRGEDRRGGEAWCGRGDER